MRSTPGDRAEKKLLLDSAWDPPAPVGINAAIEGDPPGLALVGRGEVLLS